MMALVVPMLILWLLDNGSREGSGRIHRHEFERASSGIRPIDYPAYEEAQALARKQKRRATFKRLTNPNAMFLMLCIALQPALVVLMMSFALFSTDLILGHAESIGTTGLIALEMINLLILMVICHFLLFRASKELGTLAWLVRAFLTAGIGLLVVVKTFASIHG